MKRFLTSLVRGLAQFTTKHSSTGPKTGTRLSLEALEDRVVPSATAILASLQDPTLKAAAQADYQRDGSLTRNDMIGLFQTAAQEGNVTSAVLHDLNTLVANGSQLGMPGYVQELAGKVVGFNLANKLFQDQTLLASGKLAVGSTGAQLNDLVDKWFLGQDVPDNFDASGQLHYYLQANGSLFGAGGPSYQDISQGNLGDCYFLSSLGEIVTHEPQAIQNMFVDNGDGTWTVRFFHQTGTKQVADFVTVDGEFPDANGQFVFANQSQLITNPSNVLWVALAEKAYAQLSASGWSRAKDTWAPQTNSYLSLTSGYGAEPLQQILGEATKTVFGGGTNHALTAKNIGTLNADLKASDMITLGSDHSTNEFVSDNVVAGHEYYVTGFNASTGTYTLVNPWGYNYVDFSSGTDIGTLTLTAAQLEHDFADFDVAAPVASHSASSSAPEAQMGAGTGSGAANPNAFNTTAAQLQLFLDQLDSGTGSGHHHARG